MRRLKITLLHFGLQNIGGITTCISTRYRALRERGHDVEVVELTTRAPNGRPGPIRDLEWFLEAEQGPKERSNPHASTTPAMATNHDNRFWIAESAALFPTESQIWFNHENGLEARTSRTRRPLHIRGFQDYLRLAEESDLFIWVEPFFTSNKDNIGLDFAKLYVEPKRRNPRLKQVILCHDTRMSEGYPWIAPFMEEGYIDGIMASHASAYRTMSVFSVPRVLTLTPVDLPHDYTALGGDDWSARERGLLTLSFFKSWKRGHTIFRMAPFLSGISVYSAGNGIQKRYMMADEKCKPEYRWRPGDLGFRPEWEGMRIFDVAQRLPYFTDMGWITFEQRDALLRRLQFGYDPAYHTPEDRTFTRMPRHQSIRSHWNRTTIEAMIQGAVPIVDELGFAVDEDGLGVVIRDGVNVLTMPRTEDPRELAENMHTLFNSESSLIDRIRYNNTHGLLPYFDKARNAEWIERFYSYLIGEDPGGHIGIYRTPEVGGNYYDLDIEKLHNASRALVAKARAEEQFARYNLTR